MSSGWSVGPSASEAFEHQIAHRADIGLDAFQPVGIVVTIFGALTIDAVTSGGSFTIKVGRKPSAMQSSQTVPWVLMADTQHACFKFGCSAKLVARAVFIYEQENNDISGLNKRATVQNE